MPAPRFRTALDNVLTGITKPSMHYQPVVDLRRGVTVGYEALARFTETPHISTEDWFASAQTRGKRHHLEAIVTRIALAGVEALPSDTFLSINVSPEFMLSDEWANLAQERDDFTRVVVEITEGDRVRDYPALRSCVEQIREMGGSLAVDDTGSGYASLKHVMELRPQFVKLDRFFIHGCGGEPAKSALIEMLGEAADRIDAWLVAEGIETDSELQEVMRLGVPLGQGNCLGKPDPVMRPLPPATAEHIRANVRTGNGPGLHVHVESVAVFNSIAEAEQSVRFEQHSSGAVVVDEWDRPLYFIECHALLGVRMLPTLMRVQVSSSVQEVLPRALSRPAAQRFDPLLAVDERGTYQGVLRIDHLTQVALRGR